MSTGVKAVIISVTLDMAFPWAFSIPSFLPNVSHLGIGLIIALFMFMFICFRKKGKSFRGLFRRRADNTEVSQCRQHSQVDDRASRRTEDIFQ